MGWGTSYEPFWLSLSVIVSSDYNIASKVYVLYVSGDEGKLTVSGALAGNTVVGYVTQKDTFGQNTITVKLKGLAAL